MNTATSFLMSVAASVIGYYICNWLDGHTRASKHKKGPLESGYLSGGLLFGDGHKYHTSFSIGIIAPGPGKMQEKI